jgi:hypothetical protein
MSKKSDELEDRARLAALDAALAGDMKPAGVYVALHRTLESIDKKYPDDTGGDHE